MRHIISAVIAAAILFAAPCQAAGSTEEADVWEITMEYGKDMSAQWRMDAGQNGSAIWCFSPRRNEVRVLGSDPERSPGSVWPCWSNEDRIPFADLMALVTMNVTPAGGNRLLVKGTLNRGRLLDGKHFSDYRLDSDEFEKTVRIGERWDLLAGEGSDGTRYVLNVSVERAGESKSATRAARTTTVPIAFLYEIHDPGLAGDSIYKVEKTVELRVVEEDGSGIISQDKVILENPRRDLYLEVRLDDIRILDPENHVSTQIEAVFVMNRVLAVEPVETGDTTLVTATRTIASSIKRKIGMRLLQKMRIEIDHPEKDELSDNTTEIVELKPLRIGRER